MAFRKRVFAGVSNTSRFKKRRIVRKRRFNRKSKSYGFTSQNGRGYSTNYRSRRYPGRRWRSIVWRNTATSAHYRSALTLTNTIATPLTTTTATWNLLPALKVTSSTGMFYTIAGGAMNPSGTGLNSSSGAMIAVRGGVVEFTTTHETAEVVNVTLYLIWVKKSFNFSQYNVTTSTMYDPLMNSNAKDSFRILRQWKYLEQNSNATKSIFRLRPCLQDYDNTEVADPPIETLYWYIGVSNNNDSVSNTLRVNFG